MTNPNHNASVRDAFIAYRKRMHKAIGINPSQYNRIFTEPRKNGYRTKYWDIFSHFPATRIKDYILQNPTFETCTGQTYKVTVDSVTTSFYNTIVKLWCRELRGDSSAPSKAKCVVETLTMDQATKLVADSPSSVFTREDVLALLARVNVSKEPEKSPAGIYITCDQVRGFAKMIRELLEDEIDNDPGEYMSDDAEFELDRRELVLTNLPIDWNAVQDLLESIIVDAIDADIWLELKNA